MADERGLVSLDPYDLQDEESARLAQWFGQLDDSGWAEPSGCEGWSRRDVLAHLVAVEEYFDACLNGTVAALLARYVEGGATSIDEFNAAGVAAAEGTGTEELLERWLADNARSRAGYRAADGTDIDTSIGAYPCRPQAFHAAFEYAIHADDVGAPVVADERDRRQRWLAAVGRFALTEAKDDVTVDVDGDRVTVRQGDAEATFGVDAFVAGVSGRAEPGRLREADAVLLSLGY